jgi:DNA/RNA-binding domain of Phe-tRNA-synthetase-like protein
VSGEAELRAAAGFVEPSLAGEFPGLRLDWLTVQARMRPSSPEASQRLNALANRYRGASVIAMRTHPIHHAYRAFFHQIGLDPDVTRVPSEQAAVSRLLKGGFETRDLVQDALLIALVETGVPVWALDADMLDPLGLGLRATVAGDRLGAGEHAPELPPERLVVADAQRIHALLFGEIAPGHAPSPRTMRIALFAVGVDGVPAIHIEEALWVCLESLGSG